MNAKIFALVCGIACFAVVHSTDKTAVISALTFFRFNELKNELNADTVEDQLREFVSVEQINESKFGKAVRSTVNEDNFLRVDYTLSEGGKHCAELIQLATKAIRLAENVAEGEIRCDGEKVIVKNDE
uniref:Cystatin domain-containing protein n=1 Tax=Panagrellus redivivus TaxID=6233 RepID=A0A7E4VV14_PANRE